MSARFMVMMTLALLMGAATAQAEQVFTVTTIVSAQQQADENARTGRMAHCRVLNGRREVWASLRARPSRRFSRAASFAMPSVAATGSWSRAWPAGLAAGSR